MISETDISLFSMKFEALIDVIESYVSSDTVDLINFVTWMISDRIGMLPRSASWMFDNSTVIVAWSAPSGRGNCGSTTVFFFDGICVFMHSSATMHKYTISELRAWDGSTSIPMIEEIARLYE